MKKILMITSEAEPFAKTGGLADVIGSLPKALIENGADVRVIMPKYGGIPGKYAENFKFITHFEIKMGWRKQYCGIFSYEHEKVVFYFIDNEYYFGSDIIYHYYDRDIERYSFFTRAVLESLPHLGFAPDVLHCHDWQSGMIPLLFDHEYRYKDPVKHAKTMLTIHNLQYQGIYNKDVVADFLEIPHEYFEQDKAGFFDQANFLKAGIVFSNLVTTVSETYAQEIKYPFFGENLDPLLREKSHKLFGILNGIDYDIYNPETDTYIEKTYGAEDVKAGKAVNKLALQRELRLKEDAGIPMFAIVSRLTNQKGLDLIDFVMEEFIALGAQLAVLGTGDSKYEDMFRHYSEKYSGQVSLTAAFNNGLAHKIYAGTDFFLMPSLFEPCGIGQMIAARYGSIPIVREIGGLKDTIQSYDEYSGTGNGFCFANYNAHDMLYTIKRALGIYNNKEIFEKLIKNAMSCDFSWNSSAQKYLRLYNSL